MATATGLSTATAMVAHKNDFEEVYIKQNNTKFITLIQQYNDKTEKVAWFDGFNVYLPKATGQKRALVCQCLKTSKDELLSFVNLIDKINKNDPAVYQILSEGKN